MPLFSNKFSLKKTPQRKQIFTALKKDSSPLVLDIEPIKIKLGEQESVFEDGDWIPENGIIGEKHKENEELKNCIQRLEEENNLLRLRAEILLDMLTQTTAEAHINEKELLQLRQQSTNKISSKR
ncbi:beta catenin antagonist chibby [Lycorma delicatula]|uniref:beta catenin antagonist chibby n=1 Tax=Lycorma delicatula TaxID=130591 RepID=UPI003F51686F